MIYPESVTIHMRTILFGKPGIKTLEVNAKLTSLGDTVQFDFDLMNEDLRHKKFIIDENCLIFHGEHVYQCTEKSFTKGRPHHVVAFAKPLN